MRFLTPSLLTLAGLLLAAQGDAIVRIDPLTGRREPVARINREDPGADGLPLQIDALAVAPDGSLVVSDRGLFEEQGGRILRLEADFTLNGGFFGGVGLQTAQASDSANQTVDSSIDGAAARPS